MRGKKYMEQKVVIFVMSCYNTHTKRFENSKKTILSFDRFAQDATVASRAGQMDLTECERMPAFRTWSDFQSGKR